MTLGPATVKAEFMPAAAWVDVSDLLDLPAGVQVRPACKATPWDPIEAGQAIFTLDDPTGTWWPGNPASAYYGLLRKGMPCRVTVTAGSTTSVRHLGKVRLIQPTLTGSVSTGTKITFTSTDLLADLQGRTTLDRLSENAAYAARSNSYSNGAAAWDSWPCTGEPTDDTIPSARDGSTNQGLMVWPKSGAGSVTFGAPDGATVEGPINLPGMITFEPSGAVGPVLVLPIDADTSGQFYVAWRTTSTAQQTVAVAFDGSGSYLWRIQLKTSGDVEFITPAGTTAFGATNMADGQWHTMVMYIDATAVPGAGQSLWSVLDSGGHGAVTMDTSSVRTVVVGGYMTPGSRGKQSECFAGDVTMLATVGAASVGGLENYCAMSSSTAGPQFGTLGYFADTLAGSVFGATTSTAAMPVINGPTQDSTILDLMRTIERTVGGVIWVDYDVAGTIADTYLLMPQNPAPAIAGDGAAYMTVTIGADDADGIEWTWGAEQWPTRVVVTSPVASATWVGDETDGRQDDQIDTWSATATGAYAVGGGWVQSRPDGMRIKRLTIDLATSSTGQTLATKALGMRPGYHVLRLTSIPEVPVGVTQVDLIPTAWTETYTDQRSIFDVDTIPAEALPTGIVHDTYTDYTYLDVDGAHVATNGASIGTGTGNVSVTAPSTNDLFATGVSALLDWAGEVITGSFTGSSSPQTLAISARAQAGTVARTHSNTDTISVHHSAHVTY